MNGKMLRQLMKEMHAIFDESEKIREELQNVRVLVHRPKIVAVKADTFQGNHNKLRKTLHDKAKEIITRYETSYPHLQQGQRDVLRHAAERILQSDKADSYEHYQYGHRYVCIVIYMLSVRRK